MTVTPDPEDERIVGDEDEDAVGAELFERPDEADEADVVEQQQTVPADDEDDPREPTE